MLIYCYSVLIDQEILTSTRIQASVLVQSWILPCVEPKEKITSLKAVTACEIFVKYIVAFLTMRDLVTLHFSLPPGPIPLPFIGTIYTFPKDLSDIPFVIADFTEKYGGMGTFQEPTGR